MSDTGAMAAECAWDIHRMPQLREAVYSAPDFAAAHAEVERTADAAAEARKAYKAASARVDAIWDREAERMFGPPTRAPMKQCCETLGGLHRTGCTRQDSQPQPRD